MSTRQINYSEKYQDGKFEYRHVILPKDQGKNLPARVLTEVEWRSMGVEQSRGWVNYTNHKPERHILLFRRPLGTDPITGEIDPLLQKQAVQKYNEEVAENQRMA